jgi:hypothetical protein
MSLRQLVDYYCCDEDEWGARLRITRNYAVITVITAFWKVYVRLREFYYAVIEFP